MDAGLNEPFNWQTIEKNVAASVTVIAGGGRGTGRTAADQLLRLGGKVVVTDIHSGRVDEVSDEFKDFGRQFLGLIGDSTSPTDMKQAAAAAVEHFGSINNLVYSAGAYRAQRPTLDVDSDEWDLILDSNLKGAFVTYQAFIPHIAAAGGGSLVSISSLAGRTSSPFLGCHYSAAKAGVLGLTRHIAKEFGPQGIRANSICPGGVVGARMHDLLNDLNRQEDLVQLADQTPLGRNVYEHDVVGVVLFLLSDLSRFVNGATVDVNGGILTI